MERCRGSTVKGGWGRRQIDAGSGRARESGAPDGRAVRFECNNDADSARGASVPAQYVKTQVSLKLEKRQRVSIAWIDNAWHVASFPRRDDIAVCAASQALRR
jgi:hypothetical protein